MIAVVDHGLANLRSIAKALEAVGADVLVTDRPEDLASAERLVLPGVGAFADAIGNMTARGLDQALTDEVRGKGKPLLAICLGMQLLCDESLENGSNRGLGWLRARVEPLPGDATHPVPHMGWNEAAPLGRGPLFAGLGRAPVFYFAHSYHVRLAEPSAAAASCDYGLTFTASLAFDSVVATQFHPEKSQDVGLRLLANFVDWRP